MSDEEAVAAEYSAKGFSVMKAWDAEQAAQHVVASVAELRRRQPDLYRQYRQQAFEMRQQLREELPEVDPAVVQDVTLCVLGKVMALTMALGQDLGVELAAAAAGSIGSIAVVDELWPGAQS